MKDSKRKSTTSLVVYFFLALVFALLSVFANRPTEIHYTGLGIGVGIDTRWLFWLFLVMSAASLLPLIVAALRILHERKLLPRFLDFLFEAEFREKAGRMTLQMRAYVFGEVGLLVISCAAILVLAVYLHQSRVIDDDEANGNLYDLALQLRGLQDDRQPFSTVARLLYLAPDNNPQNQLRDCAAIVNRLKHAGAKAVLISFPNFSTVVNESLNLVSEIERSGIVVWGIPMGDRRVSMQWLVADSAGKIRLFAATYLSDNEEMWKGSLLTRVRISFGSAVGNVGGDVTLALLQRYLGIPRYQFAQNTDDAIRLGDYEIPVSKYGWMYSLDRYVASGRPDVYVHRGRGWRIGGAFWKTTVFHRQEFTTYSGNGRDLDSLHYSVRMKGDGSPAAAVPIDEEAFAAKVRGKIVLLSSNYGMTYWTNLPDRAHAVALESILRRSVTSKPDFGYLWYSLFCLAVAGYLALRFRALVAILAMFLLALCALWFGSFLYESQNLLIDIFYPLLCLGIAVIVLPTVVFARRVGAENGEPD